MFYSQNDLSLGIAEVQNIYGATCYTVWNIQKMKNEAPCFFTVHSNNGKRRPVVCLNLSIEKIEGFLNKI